MKLPELPELPGPQAAIDIPDHGTVQVGWTAAQTREFAREYGEAVREACAKACDEYSKHLIQTGGEANEMHAHGAEACFHLLMGRNEFGDPPESEFFADSFAAAIRRKEE